MAAIVDNVWTFLIYFGTALALVALHLFVYTLATAHNQLALVRQNVTSAAISLGLSLIGYALPLASSVVYASSVLDCVVWGLVAIIVQVLTYWLVRLIVPRLGQRIAAGETSAALLLGAASLAAGIINAAAMR